jgi:uncharacterized protein YxjI
LNYSVYDLKQRKAGEIVEVELSAAANVLLLDNSNYSSFRSGRQHRYYGGLAKQSPLHLQVPRSGHWYLVIHMAGLRGSVRHGMRILPSALPELRQPNLRSIIEDVAVPEPESPLPPGAGEYDVFISHATEDKDGVVRDLVNALGERDVNVWYDEFQLKIGDSLRQKIDAGLARSRFGLVVVSHAFFAKNWPQYELDGLVSLEMAGRQRILPVWHEITKEEVLGYSPSLADKVALSTATYTVEEIAQEIAEVVAGSGVDVRAA